MYKIALLLAMVAVASASKLPATCKNDKAIIRMGWQNSRMLERIGQANLSAEQLNTIFPGSKETSDCGAADGIICVAEITGAVLACVAEVGTGIGIAACVAEVVGVANDCYDCVCWVIEFLGFTC